jgi:hypothetical protein
MSDHRDALMEMGAAQMAKDRARISELEWMVKALEESRDRLFEREALHTETEGMQRLEIRTLQARLAKYEREQ